MKALMNPGNNTLSNMYDYLSGNRAARYQQQFPSEWDTFQQLHNKLLSGAPLTPEEQTLYSALVQAQINNQ